MGSAVTVTVNGLARLEAKAKNLPSEVEQAMARGVNQAAGLVEGSAKRLCPVDTGNLRGSLHIMKQATPSDAKAIVGTNVEYAPYVEFGTGVRGQSTNTNTNVKVSYSPDHAGQVAQPYLAPALRNNRDRIEQIINKNVVEGIK